MNKWKHDKLFNLCTRIGDGLHGTPEYSDDSNIFFINGNNLKNGRIEITENTNRVSLEESKRNYIPLNENSLLLSINGTIGSLAFYNNERVILGKSAAYLNFKSGINRFYYYYFQLPQIQKYFYNVATGSTIKNLSLKSIQDFEVPVPLKTEWTKIASVLSALDSKIELNNRINSELEAMAKTLYDYWFVQFDFPYSPPSEGWPQDGVGIGKPYKSSGGKMVWNEELKREIPEGWKVGELQDIANITMGQSPPGESYNENGEGMIFFQGCTDFGNRYPTVRKFTTQPTRFATEGDILLSVRAPVGTINIAKDNCCIGRGLAALNSKDSCMAYLFGVMVNLKQIFDRRNVDGTTFGSINKDDLFTLKVVMPDKTVLKQYHNITNPAFEKQNKIELENQQLSSLRDWLLPMLMNGQVRVGETTNIEVKKVERKIYNINMQKLLHVASELHLRGYEKLRVVPSVSPTGMSWRCTFVAEPENGIITSTWLSQYSHNEREIEYSIIELTELFEREHMRFLESCKGKNKDYVEWYQNMLSQLEEDELPYAFAEYFSPTDYWKTTNDQKIETLPNEKDFYCGY